MQTRSLEPGDDINCETCSQRSTTVIHRNWLECEGCGCQIQEYDTSQQDRVALDEYGAMSGRGPSTKRGKRIRGSVIRGSEASNNKAKWNRLSRIDNSIGGFRPSVSKEGAARLIRTHGATDSHVDRSLELLDIGWPDGSQTSSCEYARENPIWKFAHPHGVGSSAAVCLHLSAAELGFDSKLTDWISACLGEVKNAQSHAFRALKCMRKIMFHNGSNASGNVGDAWAILQRANLGDTEYGSVIDDIWNTWLKVESIGDNSINHPRQVLAAICHVTVTEARLRLRPGLIRDRFNVGRSYQGWINTIDSMMSESHFME